MKKLLLIATAAIALTMPRVVSAHHGWGGYADQEFEISGTVSTPVSLAGPHATMTIKGTDGHDWLLTLAPPPRTSAAGLKDGMLPVGTKVTAHGHRARDNNRYEVKTERLVIDGGKTYNVYPDRT
ncbi:MAG TPA: DUF6152 family protein [Vicinamibacterales bacterium]|nr:DUF6152 family protein [Vicinamibacterales bacterium]